MQETEGRATKFVVPHWCIPDIGKWLMRAAWFPLILMVWPPCFTICTLGQISCCHRVIEFRRSQDIPRLERKKFLVFLTLVSITSNEQSDLAYTLSKMMCMPCCSQFKETALCFKNKIVKIGNLTACSKQFPAFPAVNQVHGFLS